MGHGSGRLWSLAVGALLALGCAEADLPASPRTWRGAIAARCEAEVVGSGVIDVERDYLPAVVACENGAADFEALKAQAVSARSYLYYRLETGGSIRDGTSDQVFSCGRPPGDRHRQAVAETAGEVLTWQGSVIAAFYVAGAIPAPPTCVARPEDADPTGTERFVTYNEGQRGDGNTPSPLGHPQSPRNRGCKSQNGAHCLSSAGWTYDRILRFYYGADIGLERAEGACVGPEPPDPPEPSCPVVSGAGPTVIDESDARCFSRACETGDWWTAHPEGVAASSLSTGTLDRARPDCVGEWHLAFPSAGVYQIEVAVPEIGAELTQHATYVVRHDGRETPIELDQRAAAGWRSLGRFPFAEGGAQGVRLGDDTGEPYREGGTRLVFDAVRVRAADGVPLDGGVAPDLGMGPGHGLADAAPADGARPDAGALDAALIPGRDAFEPRDASQPDAPWDARSSDAASAPPGITSAARQSGGCAAASGPASAPWILLGLLALRRRRGKPPCGPRGSTAARAASGSDAGA